MDNLIKSFKLEKFKGFTKKELKFNNLLPNKLNIVVASNGSGKTTFANALSCLNKDKFIPEKIDAFKVNKESMLKVSKFTIESIFDGEEITIQADSTKNDIKKKYIFSVINSQVKAKTFSLGGGAKYAKMWVDEIPICDILHKKSITYKFSEILSNFDKNIRKMFNNIDWFFANEECLIKYENEFYNYINLITLNRKIDDFLLSIEEASLKMTKSELTKFIENNSLLNSLLSENHFLELYSFLNLQKKYANNVELVFDCIQIAKTKFDLEEIRDYLKAIKNEKFIQQTEALINCLNTSNRNVLYKNSNQLMLKLPDVKTISNGERDLLCIIAMITSATLKIHKSQQHIVVFDEIFDYLDGANMLEFQYLLDYMIQQSKYYGVNSYFIVFTHLDPYYFKNFIFKKMNIEYFDDYSDLEENPILTNYIKIRETSSIEDNVAKYYFHYNPINYIFEKNKTFENEIEENFVNAYPDQKSFYDYLNRRAQDYLDDKKYCFAELCLWSRIACEKYVYNQLPDIYKEPFLNTHRTSEKFNIVGDLDVVPELFNIIKFVYNEGEHLDENTFKSKEKTLHLKFSTKSVKNLIRLLKEMTNF